MQFAFETLIVEAIAPQVVLLSLNRPEVRNAINTQMMTELGEFWQRCSVDQEMRCVILTGVGRAFSAGADLKERMHLTPEAWKEQRTIFERVALQMIACPLPIIATVNGAAFGGGLELVMACDFAYADTEAKFSQPEVKIGLIPGFLGTQNLPRACGIRRAKELTFTGEVFNAEDALGWGLLNGLCPPNELLEQVLAIANTIVNNAPLAVRQAKAAISQSQNLDLIAGFRFEIEAYNRLLHTRDKREGILAFNEKRKPNFTGQ